MKRHRPCTTRSGWRSCRVADVLPRSALACGRMLVEDAADGSSKVLEGVDAGTFLVELPDGTVAKADFGGDRDVVVLMLGDGVDNYINTNARDATPLRAAPHAMLMPQHTAEQARVWYGRMFLPPDQALNEKSGLSFQQTRVEMIKSMVDGNGRGIGAGCARKLAEDSVRALPPSALCPLPSPGAQLNAPSLPTPPAVLRHLRRRRDATRPEVRAPHLWSRRTFFAR